MPKVWNGHGGPVKRFTSAELRQLELGAIDRHLERRPPLEKRCSDIRSRGLLEDREERAAIHREYVSLRGELDVDRWPNAAPATLLRDGDWYVPGYAGSGETYEFLAQLEARRRAAADERLLAYE